MGYVTIGSEGRVASWGAGGSLYATILSNLRAATASWSVEEANEITTGLNSTTTASITGIRSATATIRGFALASPVLAYKSVIASSGSDYVTNARSFEFVWETTQVHDITPLPDTVGNQVLWRLFRPDITRVSGSWSCFQDSATATTLPTAAGASPPTITLTYATGAAVAGAGIVRRKGGSMSVGAPNTVAYEFVGTGNWAGSGASSIFGAYTFAAIPWSAGGSAHPLVIEPLATSRTVTFADSFIRRLRLSAGSPGETVKVEIEIQGSSTVTMG